MKKVVIVDYGMGNLQSVSNALGFLGCKALISNEAEVIDSADAYLLPGVGAFGPAIDNLRDLGLVEPLTFNVIERKKPFLGICLGMQLIAESSMELGYNKGLSWIEAQVVHMKCDHTERLPHVGWNNIAVEKRDPLFRSIEKEPHFYFDHSYQFLCDDGYVAARCSYGVEVVAAIQVGNIFATQFHPEKSQTAGLKLLRNYLNYIDTH